MPLITTLLLRYGKRQRGADNGSGQHYSITWSASWREYAGMVRPSALAVPFRDNASCVIAQIIFGAEMSSAARYAVAKSGWSTSLPVFGEGPINLVFAPPFVSNIENYWNTPGFAAAASYGKLPRVVMFDKRGTGMSDRVAELPGLDQHMMTSER